MALDQAAEDGSLPTFVHRDLHLGTCFYIFTELHKNVRKRANKLKVASHR